MDALGTSSSLDTALVGSEPAAKTAQELPDSNLEVLPQAQTVQAQAGGSSKSLQDLLAQQQIPSQHAAHVSNASESAAQAGQNSSSQEPTPVAVPPQPPSSLSAVLPVAPGPVREQQVDATPAPMQLQVTEEVVAAYEAQVEEVEEKKRKKKAKEEAREKHKTKIEFSPAPPQAQAGFVAEAAGDRAEEERERERERENNDKESERDKEKERKKEERRLEREKAREARKWVLRANGGCISVVDIIACALKMEDKEKARNRFSGYRESDPPLRQLEYYVFPGKGANKTPVVKSYEDLYRVLKHFRDPGTLPAGRSSEAKWQSHFSRFVCVHPPAATRVTIELELGHEGHAPGSPEDLHWLPVDDRIINRIRELALVDDPAHGVATLKSVREVLRTFIPELLAAEGLPHVADGDRRFLPDDKCITNHLALARKDHQLVKIRDFLEELRKFSTRCPPRVLPLLLEKLEETRAFVEDSVVNGRRELVTVAGGGAHARLAFHYGISSCFGSASRESQSGVWRAPLPAHLSITDGSGRGTGGSGWQSPGGTMEMEGGGGGFADPSAEAPGVMLKALAFKKRGPGRPPKGSKVHALAEGGEEFLDGGGGGGESADGAGAGAAQRGPGRPRKKRKDSTSSPGAAHAGGREGGDHLTNLTNHFATAAAAAAAQQQQLVVDPSQAHHPSSSYQSLQSSHLARQHSSVQVPHGGGGGGGGGLGDAGGGQHGSIADQFGALQSQQSAQHEIQQHYHWLQQP
eukprot:jgi/Mesen1/5546/ME000280S04678